MQKRWSRIFALTMVVPLLLSLLAACGTGTGTNEGTEGTVTIKIGSNFPTTGDDESQGKPIEQAVRYAIEEANEMDFLPGYKFELDARNDVGPTNIHDNRTAQRNITELIGNPQIVGIVGPLNSSIATAIMRIANEAPIALISPANTNDCLTQETPKDACSGDKSLLDDLRPTGNVTYFRIATLDQFQGAALAEFAYNEQEYKKVYIINDGETYGAGLAQSFEYFWKKLGGEVIEHRSITKTTSYENVLTTIASQKPDFIFYGGNDSTGGLTIRQQMASVPGLENMPLVLGDGAKTLTFAQGVIPLKGGPVFGSVPGLDTTQIPKAQEFLQKFQEKYGPPGAYTRGGYDATWILLQAIKKVVTEQKLTPPSVDSDPKEFREAVIEAIKGVEFDGMTGLHSFDGNGDTKNRAISIYTLGDVSVGDGWKFVTQVQPELTAE